MTATRTRKGKTRRGPSPETQAKWGEIELAVQGINHEAPDLAAFLARWSDRYAAANLERLWVQTFSWAAPATALHTFGGWHRYGRHVRAGQKAVWLRLPRTRRDDEKITPANPAGEVFTGASWTPMWDYSQTAEIGGDWSEQASAPAGADPSLVAEVKRLRAEAIKIHPDITGDASQGAARAFSAAWARYEQAKAYLTGRK
jgi:hypothetical protein